MKKRILSLLLAAVMVLALAACASTPSTTPSGSGTPSGSEPAGNPNASGGTVKIVCGYGVGGTADAIARKYALVANRLHPEYNFIVENMTPPPI